MISAFKKITVITFYLFFIVFSLSAQSLDSGMLLIKKTPDFDLTGNGNNAAWSKCAWVNLKQQRNAGQSYTTTFKMLYSNSGIYCLYLCEDKKISATLKEDFADLYNEDVVEAFFWTDESMPVYFEYELSLNYELAILVPNNKGNFFGWKPWHYEGNRKTRHATSIEKRGDSVFSWTAEFFIPFALLKPMKNVPPVPGTRWRANFYRIDYDKKSSSWTWKPVRTTFHDYEMFGTIVFQ